MRRLSSGQQIGKVSPCLLHKIMLTYLEQVYTVSRCLQAVNYSPPKSVDFSILILSNFRNAPLSFRPPLLNHKF